MKDFNKNGYSAQYLKDKDNQLSAIDFKAAGYYLRDLINLFPLNELKDAKFSAKELYGAIRAVHKFFYYDDIINAIKELKAAGFSAGDLKAESDFSIKRLKDSGFSAAELKDYYSVKELVVAKFTAGDLKAAGFSAAELKDYYNTENLYKGGFSLEELKAVDFSAERLKKSGFSAKQLLEAGFSAKQLKDGGFSVDDLKDAGIKTETN